jgi:hypothetical protein
MRSKLATVLAVIVATALVAAGEEGTVVPTKKTPLWNGKDFTGWKLFVPDPNFDVSTVWSVKDGVIHCTGTPAGYMRTPTNYANYKLHLEWRWPGRPGNSGVLLHASGPDQVWPKSIEAQLQARSAGDFWVIGGTDFKEHTTGHEGGDRRVPKKERSSEKRPGEWNEYDIVCNGDTIRVFVNGVLQNEATKCTVTSGTIGLQSEGSPIEFRNIYLEPVDE